MVDELLSLAGAQLPDQVRVETRIASDLACRAPQDRLRQALLNLVLNAGAALGRAAA
ncbi:MAG: hypothetical protein U0802_05100 [Candidatus Binatia bacterium]